MLQGMVFKGRHGVSATERTGGSELSDDPILRFRSPAYSVSIERRSGISRPQ